MEKPAPKPYARLLREACAKLASPGEQSLYLNQEQVGCDEDLQAILSALQPHLTKLSDGPPLLSIFLSDIRLVDSQILSHTLAPLLALTKRFDLRFCVFTASSFEGFCQLLQSGSISAPSLALIGSVMAKPDVSPDSVQFKDVTPWSTNFDETVTLFLPGASGGVAFARALESEDCKVVELSLTKCSFGDLATFERFADALCASKCRIQALTISGTSMLDGEDIFGRALSKTHRDFKRLFLSNDLPIPNAAFALAKGVAASSVRDFGMYMTITPQIGEALAEGLANAPRLEELSIVIIPSDEGNGSLTPVTQVLGTMPSLKKISLQQIAAKDDEDARTVCELLEAWARHGRRDVHILPIGFPRDALARLQDAMNRIHCRLASVLTVLVSAICVPRFRLKSSLHVLSIDLVRAIAKRLEEPATLHGKYNLGTGRWQPTQQIPPSRFRIVASFPQPQQQAQ